MTKAVSAKEGALKRIINFLRPKHPSEMTDEEWFEDMAWWYQF